MMLFAPRQIPTMGMLAYFVNGYVNANQLTPNYILILFIVSVLALAWAIFTLFSYHRSSSNALFVAIIDLGTDTLPPTRRKSSFLLDSSIQTN